MRGEGRGRGERGEGWGVRGEGTGERGGERAEGGGGRKILCHKGCKSQHSREVCMVAGWPPPCADYR